MNKRIGHILLTDIVMQCRKHDLRVDGFSYNELKGIWHGQDGRSLVECPEFLSAASKKRDIETGEDQK